MKDPISSGDYRKEEDPVLFVSSKTNRGPLDEDWREEYTVANKVLYILLVCFSCRSILVTVVTFLCLATTFKDFEREKCCLECSILHFLKRDKNLSMERN